MTLRLTSLSALTCLSNPKSQVNLRPLMSISVAAPHKLHLASHQSALPVDRKFNIVIYGLRESPANTNRYNHMQHDLDCLIMMFSELKLNNITYGSIKDFYRLGKHYLNKDRPRLILVKFLRAFDASLVLSSKKVLSFGTTINLICQL